MNHQDHRTNFLNIVNAKPEYHKVSAWWNPFSRGGWLKVKRESDCISVLWTSHKGYHLPIPFGPATIIDVNLDGTLRSYYRTAITLWLKWPGNNDKFLSEALEEARWMDKKLTP